MFLGPLRRTVCFLVLYHENETWLYAKQTYNVVIELVITSSLFGEPIPVPSFDPYQFS